MEESRTKQRTRKTSLQTFWTFLLEKNFEDLSVSDICEKAMITRATFYKYFPDKYNLAQAALEDFHEREITKKLAEFKFKSTKEMYLKFIEICLDYIEKHRKSFLLFARNGYNGKFRFLVIQTINDYIDQAIKKEHLNTKSQFPVTVISKFITGGFVVSMLYMIENTAKYNKKEILKWAEKLLTVVIDNK